MDFIRKHRELAVMLGIFAMVAAAVYLSAMLKPGIWFGDAFLYEGEPGIYREKDGFRCLEIKPTTEGARAVFRVGEDSQEYRLSTRTRMTEIFQDGRLKFRGTVQDGFQFLDERGEALETAPEGGPFPDFRQVYTWAMGGGRARRGNPWMLVFAALFGGALALNTVVPGLWKEKFTGRRLTVLRLALGAGLIVSLLLGFHHFG